MWTIQLRTQAWPLYKHDCTTCHYLGTVTISAPFHDAELFDLYVHPDPESKVRSTVIAKFGEGGDYHSGLEFGKRAFENLPQAEYAGAAAMGTAYALAKIKCFDVEPEPYTGV